MGDDSETQRIQAVEEAAHAWLLSGQYYEAATRSVLNRERNRTIILAGHGAGINVEKDALMVSEGHTHSGQQPQISTLYRGQHDVSKIIILAASGTISFHALQWCADEDICVLLINGDGTVLHSLTAEHCPDVHLRRKQYQASTDAQATIANSILEKKLEAQRATLRTFFPHAQSALDTIHTALTWLKLPHKPVWLYDINRLRLIEANAAKAYFQAWQGMPLKWERKAEKQVYPHWKVTRHRLSPIVGTARHAIDPCNAMLNYAYAVLEGQCRHALLSEGFDVTCGILHADKERRDSLVYDLMELFRAQVDALVLTLVQQTTFKAGDITKVSDGSCRLHPQFARYVVARCRLDQASIKQGACWLKQQLLAEPEKAVYVG